MRPGERTDPAVTRYLRAEEQVVPFRARPELGELLSWCAAEGPMAVRLVVGQGGAGKTRLALQLCEDLEANGWQPLWIDRGEEAEAGEAVREIGTPCVLIVDYAETRDVVSLLREVAAAQPRPDVRVVLLARGSGEWWQRLVNSSDERMARLLAAPPIVLGPITVEGGPNELFDEALTEFATRLSVVRPDVRLMLVEREPVVLVVHAAALLAVLDTETAVSAIGTRQTTNDVLSGLLDHERRYWQQSLDRKLGVPLDPDVIERVVAVGCLIGADDQESAMELLAVVPDLADGQLRGALARWLHDLYPVAATRGRDWIGQLRPDLIAERLVVTVLDKHPELIPPLFASLGQSRAERALTVLARAALTQPAALDQIRRALGTDPGYLVVPAMAVTMTTNPALAPVIRNVLTSGVIPADRLEAIDQAIPYPSIALAEVGAVVAGALAEAAETEDRRASSLVSLSQWLAAVGRREEALAAIEEAVTAYRQLARPHPKEFLPDLATSLNSQSVCLSALGRREAALAAIEEAVAIRRELAGARPKEFLPDLAMSLSNQSGCLSELGRREEALAAIEEAVAIDRKLRGFVTIGRELGRISVRQDAFVRYLAGSLNNMANRLLELGRWEEALAAIEEAVTIRRKLARAHPDMFLPDLATSLNSQSGCLSALGRREEALAAIEEAITISRELARAHPDTFLPDLAMSLGNQTVYLSALGRREEALAAIEEAVVIRRELARAHPNTFLPDLATALYNLAKMLSSLNRDAEASAIRQEADTARGASFQVPAESADDNAAVQSSDP